MLRGVSPRDEEGFSSCSMYPVRPCRRSHPAGGGQRLTQLSPAPAAFALRLRTRPPGLRTFGATYAFACATAWSLAAHPQVWLSGQASTGRFPLPLLPCYGALGFAPVGLSPTGLIGLSWTHNRTCGFPASGFPTDVTPRPTSQGLRLEVKPLPETPGLIHIGGNRLAPLSDPCFLPPRVRSQAPSLHRHYPASPVLRACPPPRTAQPGPRGLPVGGFDPPRRGLPVLHTPPLPHMPSSLPRRNRWMHISLASPTTAAFPHLRPGRLPHYTFRGLLNVHCALRPMGSPSCPRQPSTPECFSRFVTSTTAPIATGWSDPCRVGFAPTEEVHLCTAHRKPCDI